MRAEPVPAGEPRVAARLGRRGARGAETRPRASVREHAGAVPNRTPPGTPLASPSRCQGWLRLAAGAVPMRGRPPAIRTLSGAGRRRLGGGLPTLPALVPHLCGGAARGALRSDGGAGADFGRAAVIFHKVLFIKYIFSQRPPWFLTIAHAVWAAGRGRLPCSGTQTRRTRTARSKSARAAWRTAATCPCAACWPPKCRHTEPQRGTSYVINSYGYGMTTRQGGVARGIGRIAGLGLVTSAATPPSARAPSTGDALVTSGVYTNDSLVFNAASPVA